jgi:hypothetical protein
MRLFPLPLSRPRRALRGLRIWSLGFVWHLGFGAWSFLHRPASKFDTAPVLIISLFGDFRICFELPVCALSANRTDSSRGEDGLRRGERNSDFEYFTCRGFGASRFLQHAVIN